MSFERKPTVLLDGLAFPESPRWHDGKLWFSDMYTHRVMTVTLDVKAETIIDVPQQPSGLGWLPDGRLLVVSMHDRRLLRVDHDGVKVAAELAEFAPSHCNEMVVDRHGRAYIGNSGSHRRSVRKCCGCAKAAPSRIGLRSPRKALLARSAAMTGAPCSF